MDIKAKESALPDRSVYVAFEELVVICDSTPDRLNELLDLGWLSPVTTANKESLFRSDDVYKVRKLERICADFEIPTLGGTIIVDLLARIQRLESRVHDLQDLLNTRP